jgi:hypothetical protein
MNLFGQMVFSSLLSLPGAFADGAYELEAQCVNERAQVRIGMYQYHRHGKSWRILSGTIGGKKFHHYVHTITHLKGAKADRIYELPTANGTKVTLYNKNSQKLPVDPDGSYDQEWVNGNVNIISIFTADHRNLLLYDEPWSKRPENRCDKITLLGFGVMKEKGRLLTNDEVLHKFGYTGDCRKMRFYAKDFKVDTTVQCYLQE